MTTRILGSCPLEPDLALRACEVARLWEDRFRLSPELGSNPVLLWNEITPEHDNSLSRGKGRARQSEPEAQRQTWPCSACLPSSSALPHHLCSPSPVFRKGSVTFRRHQRGRGWGQGRGRGGTLRSGAGPCSPPPHELLNCNGKGAVPLSHPLALSQLLPEANMQGRQGPDAYYRVALASKVNFRSLISKVCSNGRVFECQGSRRRCLTAAHEREGKMLITTAQKLMSHMKRISKGEIYIASASDSGASTCRCGVRQEPRSQLPFTACVMAWADKSWMSFTSVIKFLWRNGILAHSSIPCLILSPGWHLQ